MDNKKLAVAAIERIKTINLAKKFAQELEGRSVLSDDEIEKLSQEFANIFATYSKKTRTST